jgi:hypothetical protein
MILLLAASQGRNGLFRMPNRTKFILSISAVHVQAEADDAERGAASPADARGSRSDRQTGPKVAQLGGRASSLRSSLVSLDLTALGVPGCEGAPRGAGLGAGPTSELAARREKFAFYERQCSEVDEVRRPPSM